MKTKVKDLKTGDELSSCVVLSSTYYGNYCGRKNQQAVRVRWSNGNESTQLWNRETTVNVK